MIMVDERSGTLGKVFPVAMARPFGSSSPRKGRHITLSAKGFDGLHRLRKRAGKSRLSAWLNQFGEEALDAPLTVGDHVVRVEPIDQGFGVIAWIDGDGFALVVWRGVVELDRVRLTDLKYDNRINVDIEEG
jgi:hypothetical protein